jgi:hypothetical protein
MRGIVFIPPFLVRKTEVQVVDLVDCEGICYPEKVAGFIS